MKKNEDSSGVDVSTIVEKRSKNNDEIATVWNLGYYVEVTNGGVRIELILKFVGNSTRSIWFGVVECKELLAFVEVGEFSLEIESKSWNPENRRKK